MKKSATTCMSLSEGMPNVVIFFFSAATDVIKKNMNLEILL